MPARSHPSITTLHECHLCRADIPDYLGDAPHRGCHHRLRRSRPAILEPRLNAGEAPREFRGDVAIGQPETRLPRLQDDTDYRAKRPRARRQRSLRNHAGWHAPRLRLLPRRREIGASRDGRAEPRGEVRRESLLPNDAGRSLTRILGSSFRPPLGRSATPAEPRDNIPSGNGRTPLPVFQPAELSTGATE